MVRNRTAVAAAGYLAVFLCINAVFFLAAPKELKTEIRSSPTSASVVVVGGPAVNKIMSSPVTVSTVGVATILIIAWVIWSNKMASRLDREAKAADADKP